MSTKTVVKAAPTIGANIRTIVRESINLPLDLGAALITVAADTMGITTAAIRGTVPTVKQLGTASGNFAMGAANSDLTEEELADKTAGMSLALLMQQAVDGSGSAGQSTTKAVSEFFSEK